MRLTQLDKKISNCTLCPRLTKHCKKTAKEKRKSYMDWKYWGKPVPNFGDYKGRILIVGLAPAAHGANRTGRMFTGDRSGDWLYRALHEAGFANQSEAVSSKDGLILKDALITAVAHCAPPLNKPTTKEIQNCEAFLVETIEKMKNLRCFLALGGIAWNATFRFLKSQNLWNSKIPKFGHAEIVKLDDGRFVIGSYHPSQQNTFTGRLTKEMLDNVFKKIRCQAYSADA